jgi:hypothetical protein
MPTVAVAVIGLSPLLGAAGAKSKGRNGATSALRLCAFAPLRETTVYTIIATFGFGWGADRRPRAADVSDNRRGDR